MPHSWSASKHLQKFANYLAPPRGRDVAATNGLAMVVFAMSFVLLFVLWVLVAAIPCQGRSLRIHFKVPGQFIWGEPIGKIHNRIMRIGNGERKKCNGIVREIYQVEKSVRELTSLIESVQDPSSYERSGETEIKVTKLLMATQSLERNLDSLNLQVIEISNKVESCRTKGLAQVSVDPETHV